MKWIDFNVPMLDLKGKPAKQGTEEVKMKELVGNLLSGATTPKASIRVYNMALKIYNSVGEIEIEDNDFNTLEQVIENSSTNNITKGQILGRIEDAKEESKKRNKSK